MPLRVKKIQLTLSLDEFEELHQLLRGQCTSKSLANILTNMNLIETRLDTARKLLRFSELVEP